MTIALGDDAEFAAEMLSRLGPRTRATLLRCAVPRTFTGRIYADLLAFGGRPDLSRLLERELVEAVSGEQDRFRVEPAMRAAALRAWWTDADRAPLTRPAPPALRDFAAVLAVWLRAGDPVESLHALLLVGEKAVRVRLSKLMAAADETLDVATHQDVLDALDTSDRPPLGPDLAEARTRWQAHVETQSMWEAAWYQSARYLARPDAERVLTALLDEGEGPLLMLTAMGGMGKTMQLRWFVSRWCVPRGIPCALVDVDRLDPVLALSEPWLVVLDVISQLDRQLPGRPFAEVLASEAVFLPRLRRGAQEMYDPTGVDGDVVLARLRSALAETARDRPVLVIMDTLEDLILRPLGDPAPLLAAVSGLVDQVRGLRVVLSGRHDVRARSGELARQARSLALEPFGAQSAGRYLRDVRGIKDQDVVDAIVDRSDGVPFTLALYADYRQLNPAVTAAEIRSFRGPRLMYVIERILERIDDPQVQWLLRYGVVPRRLSFAFVRDVVEPLLAESMRGGSPHDNPTTDDRPTDRPVQVWPTGVAVPSSEAGWRDLWDRLRRFADTSSWVMPVTGEPDQVTFHVAVLDAVRELLRPHPVYRLLQGAAADFSAAQAAADPAVWVRHTRDAVFHRFQHDADDAAPIWQLAVDTAWARFGAAAVAEVAAEVLGEEYLDEEGTPRPFGPGEARPLISVTTVARARVELAAALVDQATGSAGADRRWTEAQHQLDLAAATLPESDRVRVLRARILLAAGEANAPEALALLSVDMPSVRWESLVTRGDGLVALGESDAAADAYRAALDLDAGPPGDPPRLGGAPPSVVRHRLVAVHCDAGAFDLALDHARGAMSGLGEAALVLGTVLRGAGRPTEALDVLERARLSLPDGPAPDVPRPLDELVPLARARTLLAAHRLDEAVAACAVADDLDGEARWDLLACRGEARVRQLDLDGLTDLKTAARFAAAAASPRAADYWCTTARLLLDVVGDPGSAWPNLSDAESVRAPGIDDRVRMQALRAELHHWAGETARAEAALDRARDILSERHARPRHRVAVAIAALACGAAEPRLDAALADIRPTGARLALLGGLSALPAGDLVRGLRGITEPEPDLLPGDRTVQLLLRSGVLRVAGRVVDDGRTAARAITSGDSPPAAVATAVLLGADLPDGTLRPSGRLGGVCDVLLGERAIGRGDVAAAAGLADSAERALDSTDPTHWSARAAALRAEVALARGELSEARSGFATAAGIYARLGDGRGEAVMTARLIPHDRTVPQSGVPAADRSAESRTAELRVTDAGATVRFPGGAEHSVDGLTEGLASVVRGLSFLPSSALLEELDSWVTATGQRVLEGWTEQRPDAPLDVRLMLEHPNAAVLPWELLRTPDRGMPLARSSDVALVYRAVTTSTGHPVRHLQQTLNLLGARLEVDGLRGPRTTSAVSDLQRSANLPVDGIAGPDTWSVLRPAAVAGLPRVAQVLVLAPPQEIGIDWKRGHASAGGPDVLEEYSEGGADVRVVEVDRVESVFEIFERLPGPDLVHVSASLQGSRGLTLDFGASVAVRRGVDIADTQLDLSTFARLLTRWNRPTVVLDVPPPPTRSELVRALLLRNDAAHRLVGQRACDVVLGIGLGGPFSGPWPAGELARGATPPEVLRKLHRNDDEPTAVLVTALPPYTLLPVGTLPAEARS